MRTPLIYGSLIALGAALAAPAARAQAMQEWSAIEVSPTAAHQKARKAAPAVVPIGVPTVAVSGPAAGLMPNAAQPAPSARLKGDSAPLSQVLPTLTQLRPVRFRFLPGQGEDGAQYGLLPGDLARVYPELVKTNLMTGTQTINTAQLTPILVEAIKELNAQLQVLQGQQLQLAEAYARLQQENSARASASVVPAFLRRGGRPSEKAAAAPPAPDAAEPSTPTPETNLE